MTVTDPRLTAALQEAMDEYRSFDGVWEPSLAEHLAGRLASRVVWRDNLAAAIQEALDGRGIRVEERSAIEAEILARLVGE